MMAITGFFLMTTTEMLPSIFENNHISLYFFQAQNEFCGQANNFQKFFLHVKFFFVCAHVVLCIGFFPFFAHSFFKKAENPYLFYVACFF